MAGADEDAGLSCGPAGPRVQRAGALLTPEAAAVVQPPVRQVALHEVHVLPTDAAAAAEGAPRGLASLLRGTLRAPIPPLDRAVCADWRQWLSPGRAGCELGRGLLSRRLLTGIGRRPFDTGRALSGGAPLEVVVVLGHVGQDAQPVGDLQSHHVLGVQQGRDAQLLLRHAEGQLVVLVNVFLPESIEVSPPGAAWSFCPSACLYITPCLRQGPRPPCTVHSAEYTAGTQ